MFKGSLGFGEFVVVFVVFKGLACSLGFSGGGGLALCFSKGWG